MGRDANHRASEWLPVELLEAEAPQAAKPPETEVPRPAKPPSEWVPVTEPREDASPENGGSANGGSRNGSHAVRVNGNGHLQPHDNGKRTNGARLRPQPAPPPAPRAKRVQPPPPPPPPKVAKPRGPREQPVQPPPPPPPKLDKPPAPRPQKPRLDLNQIRFDQLRGLGLAPHQAAGVIGRREQRGGFRSVDELDELSGKYGLAQKSIEALKASLVV
jgi:hypothetical protein